MDRLECNLSSAVPLSPAVAGNVRARKRYPRIPCFGSSLPLFLIAILVFLSCSTRADQGGYYNDYGGYDYDQYLNGGNNYEEEQFEWPNDVSFDQVSVLPVSCIN